MKRYYLETYGCQMNVHDSERMAGLLEGMGYTRAEGPAEADVILMNTCAVREKPERKLYSELGRYRKLKEQNRNLVIGVTGCMAPRESDNIRARAPYVDLLLGPRSINRLPQLIRQVQMQRQPVDSIDLLDDPTPITPVRRASNVSAWVDVMFGCNYTCTFCAVPTARGKEVSRAPQEILGEVEESIGLGYKEVTLLGQTVNAYGRDLRFENADLRFEQHGQDSKSAISNPKSKIDFAWLLEQIDLLAHRYGQSRFRVRFTSPHPQLATDRMIDAMARLDTVCEHFHLPVQSGDDAVLRRMKRTYTTRRYYEIIDQLRERIPEVAVTTDAIVGFPGETDEQFANTLRLFERVQFDQAFMFAYSPRRYTEAMDFPDQIPEEMKKRRLHELIALQNAINTKKNQRLVGQEFEVLVEGPSEKNPNKLTGRTRTNKLMVFDPSTGAQGEGDCKPGQLVTVRADEAFVWGFQGTLSATMTPAEADLIPLSAL